MGKRNVNTSTEYTEQVDIYFILSDESIINTIESLKSTTLEDKEIRAIIGGDMFSKLLKIK